MSKVYSFRLSEDNPREAQVMCVIEAWASEGHSLRGKIVETLLSSEQVEMKKLDIGLFIEQLSKVANRLHNSSSEVISDSNLSSEFLSGIKKSFQRGIQA